MTAIPSTDWSRYSAAPVFSGGTSCARSPMMAGACVRRCATPNIAHFLKPMGRVGQIQLVKTNVRDDKAVDAALRGAHAAINLIGILSQSGTQNFRALHAEAAERIAG